MRLPPRPNLQWKQDGTPLDARVDDVYFSRDDGLSESRAVFVGGCGFPERFEYNTDLTVGELGFGTGLNFLALWQSWQQVARGRGWLNFVSFEGYPLEKADAARALSAWPELAQLSEKLIENWPVRARGVQHMRWPEAKVSLTLHIGDIGESLPQSILTADAWFLDGFSPAKNDAMWAESLWPLLAERSRPGTRIATFTVAGAVRRGLSSAGFSVERVPGHGRKRQRLEGVFRPHNAPIPTVSQPARIGIVGAGIAGASLAHVLRGRGAHVSVFETAPGPAEGTSGNPLALVMPRLDAGDTPQARLLIEAYLAARNTYDGLPGVEPVAVTHRARDAREVTRFDRLLADPPLDASELVGAGPDTLVHKQARILRPALLLPALLAGAEMHWGAEAEVDIDARTINGTAFDAIILATGWHMQDAFAPLRLEGRAGQVDWVAGASAQAPAALAAGHYALASGKQRLWGATFAPHAGGPPAPSAIARTANMAALAALQPDWASEIDDETIQSRAGVRATTPDRLPLVGPLPDFAGVADAFSGLRTGQPVEAEIARKPGLWLAGGFGSRGFTWGPWAARMLAATIMGDPLPGAASSWNLVDPARQLLRDLKRRIA